MPGRNKWLTVLMLVLLSVSCEWDDGTYTISFDANGGSGNPPRAVKAPAGEYVVLPNAPGLSRTNYRFSGWNTERANSGSEGGRFNVGAYLPPPSGDMTMYADWTEANTSIYTVTFNSNGGESRSSQQVASGRTANEPPAPARSGYDFGGWYSDSTLTALYSFSTPVTGNITLYAKWNSTGGGNGTTPGGPTPGGLDSITGLANKLAWLQANAQSGASYVLEVTADESISPQELNYDNITITLRGSGGNRIIRSSTSSDYMLFTVNSAVTLVLDSNITLQGRGNGRPVYIVWGGRLIMNAGAKITGFDVPGLGGVMLESGSSFTMNGGEISGNTGGRGGGVSVRNGSSFTMNGGEISGNTANYGGGVYINSGSFTMNGGKITGNTARYAYGNGGFGGGVYAEGNGSFTMTGGEISGNTARGSYYGSSGGGVYVNNSDSDTSIFSKTGGTIYGNNAGGNSNEAESGLGHAVYVSNSDGGKYRSSTAGPGVNLDSRTDTNWWDSVGASYTVSFDINGGSGATPPAQTVTAGESLTLPAGTGFSRSGYAFGGWNTNAAGTGTNYSSTFTPSGSITLYARWWIPVVVEVEMVHVSGGSFQMGDTDGYGFDDEQPVHTVTVSGFYMGKYDVTQAQYQGVMGTNPSAGYGVGNNYPVYDINWYDALVFCNNLSIMQGLTPAYRINGNTDPAAWGNIPSSSNTAWNAVELVSGSTGYRLPTEAQWEYACRAGTTTAFNTGTQITNNTGWYNSNSDNKTHPVGQKPANAWGLYDMHGNVYEWCWDWYGSYPSEAQTDPVGASSGSTRVVRGGSFISDSINIRSAVRLPRVDSPSGQSAALGFRLTRP
jgi:uncharacterized repeat protein (TIGR02543 family)